MSSDSFKVPYTWLVPNVSHYLRVLVYVRLVRIMRLEDQGLFIKLSKVLILVSLDRSVQVPNTGGPFVDLQVLG
jgi:hypothetical protein